MYSGLHACLPCHPYHTALTLVPTPIFPLTPPLHLPKGLVGGRGKIKIKIGCVS